MGARLMGMGRCFCVIFCAFAVVTQSNQTRGHVCRLIHDVFWLERCMLGFCKYYRHFYHEICIFVRLTAGSVKERQYHSRTGAR